MVKDPMHPLCSILPGRDQQGDAKTQLQDLGKVHGGVANDDGQT